MRPCLLSQKILFINFLRYLHEFFTGIDFFISYYPVTSKQPHKIVQIHMDHPVKPRAEIQIHCANENFKNSFRNYWPLACNVKE